MPRFSCFRNRSADEFAEEPSICTMHVLCTVLMQGINDASEQNDDNDLL